MEEPKATARVQIDDAAVRVTEYRFAPGAATGWHRHDFAYVIAPITSGPVEIVGPGGTRTRAELIAGEAYHRPAGVEHDVVHVGSGELRFLEIELKDRPG